MASISKLSVRGIRAFSPDDEEQVGANGCGKTTIIEALRYAVTGALPPGNKSGQAFVHDPKSVGSSSVKAQVKLKFNNRAGKSMVVVRSMELIQKKTTMQFKNLDGVLRTTDDQGNKQSLSHKCTELDRQIPQLVGVSKAVLDNVVFCHQEDSSWPLQDAAQLKKRFDDIFDSTRYVKALEEIKNQKKIYNNKVKEHTSDLNLLKGHKHASGGFKYELDECNHQLSLIQDEVDELTRTKMEASEQAIQAEKVLVKGDDLESQMDELRNEIDQEMVRMETHKQNLRNDWSETKSKDDLENMLCGFESKMAEDCEALTIVNDKLDRMEQEIDHFKEMQVDKSGEKGLLQGERNLNDGNMRRRIELMEELANKYGLELTFSQSQSQGQGQGQGGGMETQQSRFSNDATMDDDSDHEHPASGSMTIGSQELIQITAEDMDAFHRSVEVKREELEEQLKHHQKQSMLGEDNIQKELSELMGKLNSIENDKRRLEDEREKAKREIQKMSRTLSSSRMRKSDIDEAKRQALKYTNIQHDLNNDPRRSEIPKEIKEHDAKVSSLKHEIKDINGILTDLRQCADEQNKIEMLNNQVDQELESMQEMKDENAFLLQQYRVELNLNLNGNNGDERELVSTMERYATDTSERYETAARNLETTTDSVREKESEFSELSAVLNQNKSSFVKKKERLAALAGDGRGVMKIKATIRAARQYEQQAFKETDIPVTIEPQELLEHFSKRMGELATETDQPEAISRTMKKLKKLAKKKDAAGNLIGIICPCCTRELDPEGAEVFRERMQTLADVTSSPIVEMDEAKAKMNASATRNYEVWRNAVSGGINDWLDHKRLLKEVETLKESISESEDKLRIIETELDELKQKFSDDKDEEGNLKDLQVILFRLRDDANKIASKKSQITAKKEELSLIAPRASGKDLRATEREFNQKTDEKDTRMQAITSLNKELSELTDSITKAASQVAKANKITKDKEERFEQEKQASVKKQELNDLALKNKESIDKLRGQIVPIEQKKRMKELEKERFRSESKKEEKKRHELLSNYQNEVEKISNLSRQIKDFLNKKIVERLANLDSELKSITDQISDFQSSQREIEPERDQLKETVSNQEAHKTEVKRNIELLNMRENLQRLEDEQDLLQDQFDKMNMEELRAQRKKAKEIEKKCQREMDRNMGSKDSLMVQIRELKRKLNTKEYKDVDEKHRVKMIETETCKMAVSDLDLYYSHLDKALLQYHGVKIKDINKIIKEMWSLTYRGEDITNIRLTSDQEKSSKASKSYNYRIVMTKGTTELDMRGRCSAGQRVLASLVIRLALAETFCINCGVMALDEPTTNLDHKNKYGLAVALAQIIAHRASQDNFQLVIITHDEEFVAMMKQELASQTGFNMPDKYFQVSREESSDGCYYSKIKAIDWDEI